METEDPKSLWKVLKKIVPMEKSEPTSINIGLDVNGEVEYDKKNC